MTTLPEYLVKGVYDSLCRINGEWQPIGPKDIKEVLTAALPFLPVQGAVKVKALEWQEDSAPGYRLFSAQSDIGHFAYGTDADGNPWSSSPLGIKDHANEDAARRAAEKDHYELVVDQAKGIGLQISALEPSAARELALEEAAKLLEREACELDGLVDSVSHHLRSKARAIRTLSSPDHADDLAVDRFAIAMKQKLAKKREEGRGGWENKDECSAEYLSYLLIQHIWKGDPVDIANLAMMLQQRGDRIVIDSETSSIIPDHADAGKVEGDRWKPIESAPKEGRVLAVATGEIERISWNDPEAVVTVKAFDGPFVCYVHEDGAGFTDEFGEVYRADGIVIDAEDLTAADNVLRLTRWRPLPTPPSSEVA
ncbi:hypothetical protein BG46_15895 [Brucella anthropi]|uniref:hypothetical protein n=1 Tax=Brucella anthropi TaxID=529 RepID=UPI00044BBE93|nr:hypothetical protein [Brucella anthropi]EXL06243.1 hypothetical protein BG46_15895 [Brucella anthropi]